MPLIKTNITVPWKLHIHPHLNWPVALNPFLLLALYYLLVRMLQQWALFAKVGCILKFEYESARPLRFPCRDTELSNLAPIPVLLAFD